ncbi:VOC family protein [Streptomyces sp. NPDC058045]|uniref:VOC family protein n=1 Tax=Streptomyces sp. NPDC058045 TaxID=3346311 RepID=UPI0036EE654E
MTSLVRHITFDCAPPHDPYELGLFWAQLTGGAVHPDDRPGDDEVLVEPGEGGPGLLFIRVPEAKSVKNRLHLDLQPDRTRDEEVERVLALGARLLDDRRTEDGRGWVVCTDPAGNEFCIERGTSERTGG